jgi:hypothetical protein
MASLASAGSQSPPDDVWAGWSRFVPRLSWHDTWLVSELPADRSTTIAKSLAQAGSDAQLVLQAHRDPAHKVVQEPEAWQNQRSRKERPNVFNGLGPVASRGRKLDPAKLRSADPRALTAYLYAFVSAQAVRGADAVLLPAHLTGGHGRAGRDGELRLAELGVQLVNRRHLAKHKPLLAGIAIEAAAILRTDKAVALARSYSSLPCDGYWVQFAGLSEASPLPIVSSCSTFLFALQVLSGRRVFAVDTKNLTWPLLAGGLAGACIGIGERESWQGPQAASSKPRAIKPSAVHGVLLRNFQVDGARAEAAFLQLPCDCGAHPQHRPPLTRTEIRQHTLYVRLQMAAAATADDGVSAVRGWLHTAGWEAYDLGAAYDLEFEPPRVAAYRAVLAAAETWPAAGEL